MRIDVISDVVCPWCFIGKRNLEQFLSQLKAEHPESELPEVKWHPFQLNPGLRPEGISREEYTSSKFGGPQRARDLYARVAQAGQSVGIEFRFEDIQVQPNTIDAHQLVFLAEAFGVQDAVVESLFTGFFLNGRDLSDREVLIEIATNGGLSDADARRCLEQGELRDQITEQDAHARSLGVEGVPFFIFDQKLAVSGAQPPEVLRQAMTQANSQPDAG